jgi:nucleotidyltransferase/DNA polymerase involved in DNA repair
MPLGKVRGFGGKLGAELEALGCTTAGQAQGLPPATLQQHFGDRARRVEARSHATLPTSPAPSLADNNLRAV